MWPRLSHTKISLGCFTLLTLKQTCFFLVSHDVLTLLLLTVIWFYYSNWVFCVCLQRGSNYGSLMTGDGNLQVFAKTGYYKVGVLSVFYSVSDWMWRSRCCFFLYIITPSTAPHSFSSSLISYGLIAVAPEEMYFLFLLFEKWLHIKKLFALNISVKMHVSCSKNHKPKDW